MSEQQNVEQSKRTSKIRYLCIESSCDDTSVAVLEGSHSDSKPRLLSLSVQSQDAVHENYGGIVPELASRAHLRNLIPCMEKALNEAGVSLEDLDFFSATAKPGLIGSLLIGHSAAKTLAFLYGKEFVACDHLESHLLSAFLENEVKLPSLSLLVSGGHTSLYLIRSMSEFEKLGVTRDDAAGEAFDKGAKLLGLGFPGGPQLEALAKKAVVGDLAFPPVSVEAFDFSFSGLKSELSRRVQSKKFKVSELAFGYQNAIVDHLMAKMKRALEENRDVQSICLVGGVARNKLLRERLDLLRESFGVDQLVCPRPELCTDNAAMIGVQAFVKWKQKDFAGLSSDVSSTSRPPLKRRKNAD